MAPRTNHLRHLHSGIILLVVMGMLAVFSLLAISFLVFSGNSRTGSVALERPKQKGTPGPQLADMVVQQVLRGSNDPLSAFRGHSVMGDVYGPNSIAGAFAVPASLGSGGGVVRMYDDGFSPARNLPFAKVPLSSLAGLASEDDAYNGRLITFTGGPLVGQTFRVLQYIGNRTDTMDPSYPYRYSVVIDLSTVDVEMLQTNGFVRSAREWLDRWVGTMANEIAFGATDYSDPLTYVGYGFLLNDAPFNGVGYGLEVSGVNVGNLAQGVWVDPANPNGTKIPVGLLHQYNGATLADGTTPDPVSNTWMVGGTNEGFDVADYRDLWLARAVGDSVIPSFHRPEVINFISNLYGDPASLSRAQLIRFLNILDYASARPIGLSTGDATVDRNTRFAGRVGTGNPFRQSMLSMDINNWPNTVEVQKVQAFVAWMIEGPWDVDNNNDGRAESVWTDPNLPLITAADGKLLKVLVAPMIEDLDGRLNVNSHGDWLQSIDYTPDPMFPNDPYQDILGGYEGVNRGIIDDQYAEGVQYLSQGFGYGPGEISFLAALPRATFATLAINRYGTDGVPGRVGNDAIGRFWEREVQNPFRHFPLTNAEATAGLPLSRRGQLAVGIDRFGNPLLRNIQIAGAPISETLEDPYELPQRTPAPSDTPYELSELEAVLRRFDSDTALLPSRIRRTLGIDVNDTINSIITTRSAEIRSPVIGAPVIRNIETPPGSGTLVATHVVAGNLLGWVQLLYEERYRTAAEQTEGIAVDSNNLRRLLLPTEFRKGLRLNLNRPFGDGLDTDNDGQIDEPHELHTTGQTEGYPGDVRFNGEYAYGVTGSPARLASRQLLARQLYCLAQLLVPRAYDFPGTSTYPKASQDEKDILRARILAQWAVNVVDFRDEDAAMTRFEYDVWPWGKGSSGGNPAKFIQWNPYWPNAANSNDPSRLSGNVVWGMEFPELVLSEAIAFHDKRVNDTDEDDDTGKTTNEPNPAENDNDLDQYRLPQGSTFFEVVGTRTTSTADNQYAPAASSSLYTTDGSGNVVLDLARMSGSVPGVPQPYGIQPVWRIGIGAHQPQNETSQYQSTASAAIENANGLPFSLSDPAQRLVFDRMVWFTSTNPVNVLVPNLRNNDPSLPPPYRTQPPDASHRIFRYRGGSTFLAGGSYCVIGPRAKTFIGSNDVPTPPVNHEPSPQYIELAPNAVTVYKMDDTVATSLSSNSAIKPAVGMIVAADPPNASWNPNFPLGVGLNISEPVPTLSDYYSPRPPVQLNSMDSGDPGYPNIPGFADLPPDSWKDFATTPSAKSFPDEPFDTQNGTPIRDAHGRSPFLEPDSMGGFTGRGETTISEFNAAFLQRLADPDFPYDPINNPYITIDWLPIDLTVFNGEDSDLGGSIQFQSRYKDGRQVVNANAAESAQSTGMTFLTYSTAALAPTPAYMGTYGGKGDTPYFRYQMGGNYAHPWVANATSQSLGYLNEGKYLSGLPGANPADPTFYDAYGPAEDVAVNSLDGGPKATLASIFWFNRPFATAGELMIVPYASPGQLNQLMRTVSVDGSKVYVPDWGAGPGRLASPFGCALDFFGKTDVKNTKDGSAFWMKAETVTPSIESDLSLLMELVETPSPFSDAGRIIPPREIVNVDASTPNIRPALPGNPYFLMGNYLPPGNDLSSFVHSGKININTIHDAHVWEGIEWNYYRGTDRSMPNGKSNWEALNSARRGYVPSTANAFFSGFSASPLIRTLHPGYPTQYAGAFRSGFLANIAPDLPNVAPSPAFGTFGLRGARSDAVTLYRPRPDIGPNQPGEPLFLTGNVIDRSQVVGGQSIVIGADRDPADTNTRLFRNSSTNQTVLLGKYQQADRQNYIALQRMMRLPNLVSQQSNVLSVRLTIGFFEYDPVHGLGPEHVGTSGETKRHRAFYVIDRSIPVGYRTGEDLNTEKTILLRRYIK